MTHLVLPDGVLAVLPTARLQSLVAQRLETHAGHIKAGRLFGIAHPKGDVVEAEEFASLWFSSFVGVAGLDVEKEGGQSSPQHHWDRHCNSPLARILCVDLITEK